MHRAKITRMHIYLCKNIMPFQSQLANKLGTFKLHATSIQGRESKGKVFIICDEQ